MQALMSIDAAYKERVEEELKDLREQLRAQKERAAKQLRAEKERAEEQLRLQREQTAQNYIEAGLQFGADPDALREHVRKKFGFSDAVAMARIEVVEANVPEKSS